MRTPSRRRRRATRASRADLTLWTGRDMLRFPTALHFRSKKRQVCGPADTGVTVTVTKIATATRARPPYATTRTPPCRAQPWDGVCWYDSVTLSHVRRPYDVLVQCRIPVGIISILTSESRRLFSMDGPDAIAAQRRLLLRCIAHLTGHVGHAGCFSRRATGRAAQLFKGDLLKAEREYRPP